MFLEQIFHWIFRKTIFNFYLGRKFIYIRKVVQISILKIFDNFCYHLMYSKDQNLRIQEKNIEIDIRMKVHHYQKYF